MTNGIERRFSGLNHDMVFAAAVFIFKLRVANLMARDENELYRQYNNSPRERSAANTRLLAGYSHFLFSAVKFMPQNEEKRGHPLAGCPRR